MNDLLLLAALLDGPKHGYALKKRAALIWGEPALHNNIVYPLLGRFVAHGWVTERRAAGERGQVRRVYTLAPRGRQALVEKLSEFGEAEARSREAFRLRVGLFAILSAAAREGILAKREAFLRSRVERFVPLARQIELGTYGSEVVRFIRGQIAAELAWIARLRRISERGRKNKDRRKRT
jgi:DNA-binding PadR family transcriptional regulator